MNAQDSAPVEQTRAAQIDAAAQAKAASIVPEPQNAMAQKGRFAFTKLFNIWNFTQTGGHGLSLRLGGLAVGSGLALGPEYVFKRGEIYDPSFIWDSYAVGSLQGYYRLQSSAEFPRLLRDHGFFSATALRFDYPRLAYYGAGPDSRESGRTDYRMQDNDFEIRGGVRPFRKVQLGLVGSFQRIAILSGTASGIAQTDATYTNSIAHGDDRDADFFSGGFFAQYDSRDIPRDPHSGTYVLAEFQNINGSRKSLGGFNQYDLDAQHYFHYWNKRRVIATRVKAALTAPHPNTFVPFYLEPRLGGSDDLRGFRPYRFYDQNAVIATTEYRWTVMEALDMAVFADAGKVYRNWDTFSLAKIQTDIGIGIRGRVGESVPLRIDVGCSREGVQVWFTFYNVF